MTRPSLNRRILALGLAASLLAATLAALAPQHLGSVARLGAATLAALVGVLVLGAVGAHVGREVPTTALDAEHRVAATPLDPHGLRDARRDLDRPASPGLPPPAVWDRLHLAAALRFQDRGIDLAEERGRERAAAVLAPTTWRILADRPASGTTRSPAAVAAVVERVLDDLDALTPTTGASHGHR